jgi:CDGSH-type Zn-finger protein
LRETLTKAALHGRPPELIELPSANAHVSTSSSGGGAELGWTASDARRAMAEVEIKVRHNGPYKVTGPIRLIDADGNEFELPDDGKPIALCRCGGSKTKPFCDKTHSEIGFQAAERAVAEADADAAAGSDPE